MDINLRELQYACFVLQNFCEFNKEAAKEDLRSEAGNS